MVPRVLTTLLALALALAGCERRSELYCGKHPEDVANCGYVDAGIDARPPCMSAIDCMGTAAVCEPLSGTCVECTTDDDCTDPAMPYCDMTTFSCKGCVQHDECASEVCLPTGVCGDDTDVAYVDPTAAGTTCTFADRCKTVALAVATGRPFIKLEGAIVEVVQLDGITRTLLGAPGTSLKRANGGVTLEIKGGSAVSIYDLHVIGNDEVGIKITGSTARLFRTTISNCNKNDKPGVAASAGATLSMSRCIVHSNRGGGVLVDATSTFNLTNNFIYRNGHDGSSHGGLRLLATNSGVRRLEMNTVVDNRTKIGAGISGGVACLAADLETPNNLIVRNYAGGLTAGTANTLATGCIMKDSQLDPDASPYAFIMPDGDGPWDYHIGAGSLAIDRGVASDIGFDIDGQPRPQGARFDHGADEYKQGE
jgi:hypothetical protein